MTRQLFCIYNTQHIVLISRRAASPTKLLATDHHSQSDSIVHLTKLKKKAVGIFDLIAAFSRNNFFSSQVLWFSGRVALYDQKEYVAKSEATQSSSSPAAPPLPLPATKGDQKRDTREVLLLLLVT